MIIHTSLRIDIPAFYSEWFTDRIREGYVLVRVPYNPLQVTEFEAVGSILWGCEGECEKMMKQFSEEFQEV